MALRLHEVAEIDEHTPLDLWGGLDGELGALYLSTGARQGGSSKIFRHRKGSGDGTWQEDPIPGGAETMNKIRDDGVRVYAFFETGGPQFIISRPIAEGGTWGGEPIDKGEDFVGGRGLGIWIPEQDVVIGGSDRWNATLGQGDGQLYRGNHDAGYALQRGIAPGILWEAEYAEDGALWEFWHKIEPDEDSVSQVFRAGAELASPVDHVSCVADFLGQMYACGDQSGEDAPRNVWRYNDGWEVVHVIEDSLYADHVCRIRRKAPKPPELWLTGFEPFRVARSFNGTDWEYATGLPEIPTGTDTNQLTAVGFFDKRVWVATRDADRNRIRVFVDELADLHVQII
jgi:hypothetical protein